jgi:hypothetical protein
LFPVGRIAPPRSRALLAAGKAGDRSTPCPSRADGRARRQAGDDAPALLQHNQDGSPRDTHTRNRYFNEYILGRDASCHRELPFFVFRNTAREVARARGAAMANDKKTRRRKT